MYNPLHRFELRMIDAFRRKHVLAFVKQSYDRGRFFADDDRESFVMIHFERMIAARQYYDVLKDDPAREIFQMHSDDDMRRLKHLIQTQRVFTMLKEKDADIKAKKLLDKKLRLYVEQSLHWQPSSAAGLRFSLDVQFGEVYAKLRSGAREIKVKLAEIETFRYVL